MDDGGRKLLSIMNNFNRSVSPARQTPRGLRIFLLSTLIGSGLLSGMYYGGYGSAVVNTTGQTIGLANINVILEGNHYTPKEDIVAALQIDSNTILANFDINDGYDNLLKLPWIESAQIALIGTTQMKIKVTESKAYSIWEDSDEFTLHKKNGDAIESIKQIDYITSDFSDALHHLEGIGAPDNAQEIISTVAKFESVFSNVKSYIRVGDRRWNLLLDNKIEILLPEHNAEDALKFLVKANESYDIYERPIRYIDLRLDDKVVLGLIREESQTHGVILSDTTLALGGLQQ